MVKDQLSSSTTLAHYDPNQKLFLTCDASSYGLGAVLSQQVDDGTERPFAFASRSLSTTKRKYSQLDKEGLAIIFGVTRFRQYLLGHHFVIRTDHKPLIYLFGESCGIWHPRAFSDAWAMILSAYIYSIIYKAIFKLANADRLGSLPFPDAPAIVPVLPDTFLLLESMQLSPVTVCHIKQWTATDPIMSRVLRYVLQGWPATTDEELLPYSRRWTELSI